MMLLLFIIACGESSKKDITSEFPANSETILNVGIVEDAPDNVDNKPPKVKVGSTRKSAENNKISTGDIQSSAIIESSNKIENISNLNQTEQAKYKIKQASDKTACMIEYFNRKEAGEIQVKYEEFCR